MGASSSHPISSALQELLKSKGLKIQRKTIEKFLDECDTVAPWFAISGNLTVACWEKLGRDLDVAWEQGILKGGMKAVWRIVRSCLDDEHCCRALEASQQILEQLKEERLLQSEKAKTSSSSSESETEEELERLAKRVEKTSCTLT
jgi:protein O-GlcNAc transferase